MSPVRTLVTIARVATLVGNHAPSFRREDSADHWTEHCATETESRWPETRIVAGRGRASQVAKRSASHKTDPETVECGSPATSSLTLFQPRDLEIAQGN